MSQRYRTVVSCLVLLGIAVATSVFLITRASPEQDLITQSALQLRPNTRGPRNLFLQPEALRVARRLGKRFSPSGHSTSVMMGTLTISESEQPLMIIRRQTQTGEQLELLVGNRSLTWNEQEGTKAIQGLPSDIERLLVERLALDSPDQFVLAQLRGASYLTIARNVRPTDANDGYSGPLWDLVRVSEPQQSEALRPLSTWRIYYLNVQTGLPDRIEYQLNGQPIVVEFVEWNDQGEEKSPSHVRWSSNGQPLMDLRVASITHNQ